MEREVYAVSWSAHRSHGGDVYFRSGLAFVLAASRDEAWGATMRPLLERLPEADGWRYHLVVVAGPACEMGHCLGDTLGVPADG